ncbi:MAG: lamin tail domain-containing protein, partial [Planctomycetes bacterium]|nr:lamin tail domain-containing protein [Planctomycetota bacterium]
IRGEPAPPSWLYLFTRLFGSSALRERYLRRVEQMIEGDLAPEVFDRLVDSELEKIRDVVVHDPRLWPFDRGDSALGAPARLKAAHRRRLEILRRTIDELRGRRAEPLAIRGFLVRPRGGAPWVEIENRSESPVDLSGYRLSVSLESAGRALFGERVLDAGAAIRWPLAREGEHLSPAGGVLSLWRRDEERRATVLADFAIYGYQSEGLVYGRSGGGWGFIDESEQRAGGDISARKGAGYDFVHGVEESSGGDLRIWFKPLGLPVDEALKIEVLLRYRPVSDAEWEEIQLRWEETLFRFSVALEKSDDRPRTAYYFLARAEDGVERAFPLGAPDLTCFLDRRPEITINEVCPRPGPQTDSPGEFIELHNASDRPVSLRGMYLTDTQRLTTRWRIAEDVVIAPGGYEVFYADGLDRGRHTDFKLSNSGEFLGLFGPVSEGNLKIDAIAFRGVPPGQSWGRTQDATKGFRVWRDPTPGRRNMPKIPPEYLERQSTRD